LLESKFIIIVFKKIIKFLLKLLFPDYCLICSSVLELDEDYICDICLQNISEGEYFCEKCGSPVFFCASRCNNCLENVIYYKRLIVFYLYSGTIKRILREIKYNPQTKLFENFEVVFNIFLSSSKVKDLEFVLNEVDFVLPVPIHKNRLQKRGYNQSVILSEIIRICFNKNYYDNLLIKCKDTEFFYSLNKDSRRKEIDNAFLITDLNFIKNKNILIVDDISTTGTTFNNISKLLLDSGARNVYVFCLAHGY